MNKEEAYRIVFNDLTKCNLNIGIYDARDKARVDHFMNGIATVMEQIAYGISEEVGDTFSEIMINNKIISENKAEIIKLKEKIKTLENEIDTLEDENDKLRAEIS